MPAINCDQFTKILDDKLIPLNSTISELKTSVNEAMSMNFSLFNILVAYLTLCVRFSVFFVLVSLT